MSSADRTVRRVAVAAALLLGLLLPVVLGDFWTLLGSLVFAASIGAIGLMLLFGRVGQLSLGHPFFLAVGAYVYMLLAAPRDDGSWWGLGMPSLLALLAAVVAATIAGLLLSPLAARLKGLSLGMATLSLTFIAVWLLYTLEGLTGGFNGRDAPPLQIGPFSSAGSNLAVLGLPIGANEFLWYVTLACLVAVAWFTTNLLAGRVGRAFTAIRDAEVHAGALGVQVGRYRALAFAISSAFAGLAGALLAIVIHRVVPDYWGLELALSYLAMIVIGGMRSVTGAILGAAIVTALPALLHSYGHLIPGVGTEGGPGLGPSVVAQLVYATVVILVLLFEPDGLVVLLRRLATSTVWSDRSDRPGRQERPPGPTVTNDRPDRHERPSGPSPTTARSVRDDRPVG